MSELQLKIKTPPTVEPITLADAKLHLKVEEDVTEDDTLIASQIKAARIAAENFTMRQFITATYELFLDKFPTVINVPRPPLQSVTSIKYIDTDGAEQTLNASVYTVDTVSMAGRIVLAFEQSWPQTRAQIQAVTVEYKAGYGDAPADVLDDIIAGMKLHLGHLYENREDVVVGVSVSELPKASESLLYPYRILGGV